MNARLAGRALVLGVAVVTAFWGLGVRDLGAVELEEFAGSGPLQILVRAISPAEADWGAHMPLTHVIRWVLVALLGATNPVAWRLHVAVASVAGALLAHQLLARSGRDRLAVLAGLIVASHPLVSFHAHESGNYGFGAMLGGLLLLALVRWDEGRPRADFLLAGAVVLGMSSDLFFVFPAAAACAWTVWRAAGEDGLVPRVVRTWGTVLAAGVLPGLWFLRHALRLRSEHLIGPHADPIPPENAAAVAAAWDLLRRFGGGLVGGYLDSGERDLWLVGGPVVLVLVTFAALLRAPRPGDVARSAAWIVAVGVGLVLCARLGFGAVTGREFTTEPRIYANLVVPLAVGWAALCGRLGPWAGGAVAALLLTTLAIPTARQLASLSDRDTRAAAFLSAHVGPDDVLVTSRQVRWRLPPSLRARAHEHCIEGTLDLPDRVWLAVEQDGERLQDVLDCDDGVLARPGQGWRVREHQRLTPPPYDRRSASFLPELVLAMLERGPVPDGPVPLRVRVTQPPGSGAGALTWVVDGIPSEDGRPLNDLEERHFEAPVPSGSRDVTMKAPPLPAGSWARTRVRRTEPLGDSWRGLLAAFESPVRDLDAVPVLADPLAPTPLRLEPFAGPHVRTAERLLRWTVACLLLLGLPIARWRRRRASPPG